MVVRHIEWCSQSAAPDREYLSSADFQPKCLLPHRPLQTQSAGRNKASLDGVNEYRLEAAGSLCYIALRSVERSLEGQAVKPSPRTRRGDATA
jgi:hypothetical protein